MPELFSHLYIVGREHPHILTNSLTEAISLLWYFVTRFCQSAGFLASLRPRYFPCALARAIPSRCRSSMILRSKVAMAANMVIANSPAGVDVSKLSFRDMTCTCFSFSRCTMSSKSFVLRASRENSDT